jgi:hypothetical protein
MYKYTSCIILVIALTTLFTRQAFAWEFDQSATLKSAGSSANYDYRVENLNRYLTKNDSPLAVYSEEFVLFADKNGLDYRLVPAITGVESTFGKRIPGNSYNAYGWANGNYTFKSWSDSIEIVSSTLRSEYINKGAPTINKIAKRYAPPSTTWASKVNYFVGKIDSLPVTFDI